MKFSVFLWQNRLHDSAGATRTFQRPQIFSLVLGIWALVEGIIMLVMAFRGGGWGTGILGGIGILLGLVLIGSYGDFGMGIAFLWTAAVFAVVGGIVLIIQSFRARAERE